MPQEHITSEFVFFA